MIILKNLGIKLVVLVTSLIMALGLVIPQHVDAAVTSSSSASSASSAASSGARASSSASSASSVSSRASSSYSSAMNSARASQAQNAARQSSMSSARNSVSYKQATNSASKSQQAMKQSANAGTKGSMSYKGAVAQSLRNSKASQSMKTLTQPKGSFNPSKPYSDQWMHTSFYNNWLFYNLMNAQHDNNQKVKSVESQFMMLKQHMKPHEKLYTLTIHTKQGDRLISVPKKDYDRVKKGSHVTYHNGQLQVS